MTKKNMEIWNAVSKTDPSYTKKVNQRGGFTAIDAQYQIQMATEQFGAVGVGWGYDAGSPIITAEGIMFVPVTLWHGSRENTYGPELGGCTLLMGSKPDADAGKKATTDALTKLLSRLGFNADVFLGKFDDNRYVQQRSQEVQAQSNPHTSLLDDCMGGMKKARNIEELTKAIQMVSGVKDDLKANYGGAYQSLTTYYQTRKAELTGEKQ